MVFCCARFARAKRLRYDQNFDQSEIRLVLECDQKRDQAKQKIPKTIFKKVFVVSQTQGTSIQSISLLE